MQENDNNSTINRRRVLATLGAAGVAGLAGCGSSSNASVGEPSEKDVPPPSVDAANRWELTTPNSETRLLYEGSQLGIEFTAHGHTVQYADKQLRQRISENTFGEVDREFAVAFAARIDIFPSYASSGTAAFGDTIESAITDNLRSSMEEFGVQNVIEDGRMEASNTPADDVSVLRGEYPINQVTIRDVNIPHSDREQLSFGDGTLPIKGIAGRWKSGGSIMAAGGVYPDEPFIEENEVEMSDAVTLSMEINLGLNPTQRENQVLEFIDSVSR